MGTPSIDVCAEHAWNWDTFFHLDYHLRTPETLNAPGEMWRLASADLRLVFVSWDLRLFPSADLLLFVSLDPRLLPSVDLRLKFPFNEPAREPVGEQKGLKVTDCALDVLEHCDRASLLLRTGLVDGVCSCSCSIPRLDSFPALLFPLFLRLREFRCPTDAEERLLPDRIRHEVAPTEPALEKILSLLHVGMASGGTNSAKGFCSRSTASWPSRVSQFSRIESTSPVSYTHLTLPTTPYV